MVEKDSLPRGIDMDVSIAAIRLEVLDDAGVRAIRAAKRGDSDAGVKCRSSESGGGCRPHFLDLRDGLCFKRGCFVGAGGRVEREGKRIC